MRELTFGQKVLFYRRASSKEQDVLASESELEKVFTKKMRDVIYPYAQRYTKTKKTTMVKDIITEGLREGIITYHKCLTDPEKDNLRFMMTPLRAKEILENSNMGEIEKKIISLVSKHLALAYNSK